MSKQNKLVACVLALCVPGFSQSPVLPHGKADWNNVTSLARAAEVRVQVSGSRSVRGGVLNVTEDSLAVNSASGQETFARQEVLRVSVRKPGQHGRSALAGLAIGAVAGAGIGLAAEARCTSLCGGGVAAVVVGVVALGGAGIGTAIGAVIPASGWREVYRQ